MEPKEEVHFQYRYVVAKMICSIILPQYLPETAMSWHWIYLVMSGHGETMRQDNSVLVVFPISIMLSK